MKPQFILGGLIVWSRRIGADHFELSSGAAKGADNAGLGQLCGTV